MHIIGDSYISAHRHYGSPTDYAHNLLIFSRSLQRQKVKSATLHAMRCVHMIGSTSVLNLRNMFIFSQSNVSLTMQQLNSINRGQNTINKVIYIENSYFFVIMG